MDDRHRAAKNQPPLAFAEFFHAELVRQQIHQNRVAEVAYNVLDACKRYSYDVRAASACRWICAGGIVSVLAASKVLVLKTCGL